MNTIIQLISICLLGHEDPKAQQVIDLPISMLSWKVPSASCVDAETYAVNSSQTEFIAFEIWYGDDIPESVPAFTRPRFRLVSSVYSLNIIEAPEPFTFERLEKMRSMSASELGARLSVLSAEAGRREIRVRFNMGYQFR